MTLLNVQDYVRRAGRRLLGREPRLDGRDYVRWAYRLLLGREPESRSAVDNNPFRNDRVQLLRQFLHGREFLERHGAAFALPPDLFLKRDALSPEQAAPDARQLIVVDRPVNPRQRPFHETRAGKAIHSMIEASRPRFLSLCRGVAQYGEWFQKIPLYNKGSADPAPAWINDGLPGLDAMFLYSLVVSRNPGVYLEVGSGDSTRFVRRAITDHNLRTRIISIDPRPSAGVVGICDELIRRPLEEMADLDVFSRLSPEDVVFIDNSHRSFQNSDVTVFFTEILPLIPSGVIYGIRDIFLPVDYPDEWADRFYNEQYLLACYLLGGAGGDKIAFPGLFVSLDTEAKGVVEFLHHDRYFRGAEKHAGAFWLERGRLPAGEIDRGSLADTSSDPFVLSLDKRTDNGMFLSEIAFLRQLEPTCRILDVGCGNNSPHAKKGVLPNCNYTGIDVGDYNQTMPMLADKYIVASPESFADEIYKMEGQFDAVISTHNIEHCNDREKTLDAMLKALKPGGELYMLFPSEISVDLPSRGGCLNYFDDGTHKELPPKFDALIDTIKRNNFRIIFAEKQYRPLRDAVRGLINEKESLKRNTILPGTWSYYGFESLIWAKRNK